MVEDNALYALIRSYRQAIRAMKKSVHRVSGEMQSISDKIWELKERLFVGVKTTFFQLLPESRNVSQVLVTFLSLLELTRMGFISIFQSHNFAGIHIETNREIEGDVISKAESFEASNTEEVAEALLANFAVDVPDEVNEESLEPAEMAASDEDILREEQLMAEEDRIKLEQSGEVHES